ncbi:hypothetical protein EX30DRAFT_356033 [Ascodesmis nigricans]|uniref:PH domain-containing protein n=1 Tax=Ascodesmis nigricans TaxID=341454 RepID=A0A4S2MN20_9PEZI|nr:hypothetical protein EX30DRAFT_356033 [Ascodesmis nigricans]
MTATDQPPTRSSTLGSDAAIPPETGEIGVLLIERLRAWKHAVKYLESYVDQMETLHKGLSKDYHKVLKTVDEPLKEGHHFDQTVGGVASFFENLRANTVSIGQTHTETATALKSQVLPILERLHKEIKDRAKHVQHECERATKMVAKTRNATQSQIELLGQHASNYSGASTGAGGHHLHLHKAAKPKPEFDPWILKRGVLHRLQHQVQEENTQQNDLIGVQKHFGEFEAHVVTTVQAAIKELDTVLAGRRDKERALLSDLHSKSASIPTDFEWTNFLTRNSSVLIPLDAAPRTVDSITFPNSTHPSTIPTLHGSLQRKGKIMRSYYAAYYVLTPAGYLHEFKDQDSSNHTKDSDPESSLYLPECSIGALSPEHKFIVSGKDTASTLGRKKDFAFKCGSREEAVKWYEALSRAAGVKTEEVPAPTPVTPEEEGKKVIAGTKEQEEGVTPPPYTRHDTAEGKETVTMGGAAPGVGTSTEAAAAPAAAPAAAVAAVEGAKKEGTA